MKTQGIAAILLGALLLLSGGEAGAHLGADEKLDLIDKALKKDPDNKLLLTRRAVLRRLVGHLEESRTDLDGLIEKYPGDAGLYRERALTHLAGKDLTRAEEDLTRALALIGGKDLGGKDLTGPEGSLYALRAGVLAQAGRAADARLDYDRAARHPQKAQFYLDRGRLLERIGDPEAATANYRDGLAATRALAVRLALVRVEVRRQRFAEALALLDELIGPDRFNARWLLMKADVLDAAGAVRRAHDAHVLSLSKGAGEAGSARAARHLALAECEERRSRGRFTALHRMHYADALRAVGRVKEAAAEIEAVLKVSPELPQAVEIKRRIDRAVGRGQGGRREAPASERPDGKGA